MVNNIPIIILTRDNPEFLYVTLKSLSATELFDNPIIIFDNSSELNSTKNFYNTSDEFEVSFDDWTAKAKNSQEYYDKAYSKTFLAIPQIKKIKGISRKFQVVSTKQPLPQETLLLNAINFAFTVFKNAKHCCIIDDNILFNKNWLKEAIDIYNDNKFMSKVGIVSTYSESEIIPIYRYKIDPQLLRGKMLLISKNLYTEMTHARWFTKFKSLPGKEVNFIELERLAYRLGYVTIVTGQSYIQSLEKRNLCTKDKFLKYENNFKKPIAWNDKFLEN